MTVYELEAQQASPDEATVVEIRGELDLTNASEVERRLTDLASRGSGLIVDLNRVTFIDSAALHMLFRLARRVDRTTFGIVLEPTALVARTLAIVGMSDVANIRPTVDDLVSQPTS